MNVDLWKRIISLWTVNLSQRYANIYLRTSHLTISFFMDLFKELIFKFDLPDIILCVTWKHLHSMLPQTETGKQLKKYPQFGTSSTTEMQKPQTFTMWPTLIFSFPVFVGSIIPADSGYLSPGFFTSIPSLYFAMVFQIESDDQLKQTNRCIWNSG